jgi:formylglycine-generating enzyme required for sulfatase activity
MHPEFRSVGKSILTQPDKSDMAARCILNIAALAMISIAAYARDKVTGPVGRELETQIAGLKAGTAALVSPALARLDALSPRERLAAPPAIWRVSGALREFRDCADCPTLVVVPAGEYTMGSPPAEQQAAAPHRVTIRTAFAVSKFEITFAEWDACAEAGGCGGYRPDDEGWGRGNNPVMNISWLDAQAYASWLSLKTGKTYRLLSESEWEYAARAGRAGTRTVFPVGDTISSGDANFNGSTDGAGPSDQNRQKTLSIGSFAANAFGLHDMLGNVSEWVEDCWNDNYSDKTPTDGSAWLEGSCKGRVVRGGSWEDSDVELHSAARTGGSVDDRFYTDGLRIARTL